jgi:ribosomal-protein-alanine N-acetyltransferase
VRPADAITLLPADLGQLHQMMAVMHAAFDPAYGEAWTTPQLAAALGFGHNFGRVAQIEGFAAGFTLCRSAGPEVELLLIAVHPDQQRMGLGQQLLVAACNDARRRGAQEMFLEVRENNAAAQKIYAASGFAAVGRRPDYYSGEDGTRFGAITMRRSLDDLLY